MSKKLWNDLFFGVHSRTKAPYDKRKLIRVHGIRGIAQKNCGDNYSNCYDLWLAVIQQAAEERDKKFLSCGLVKSFYKALGLDYNFLCSCYKKIWEKEDNV